MKKEKDTSGKIMSLLNSFLVKKTRVLRETANTLNKQILDGLMFLLLITGMILLMYCFELKF